MNAQELYRSLKLKLGDVVPDFELRDKAEVACEVERLKDELNAVILAHNYMEPALFHSVPDFTGDSLDLSRKARDCCSSPTMATPLTLCCTPRSATNGSTR